jgi:uncharacterized protein YydD (DUF2326 family)
MFLKNLQIVRQDGTIIRDIQFHLGLNLIVDETPTISGKETGNNVGKTTVLKLIDFCLGGSAKDIYTDPENQKNEYKLVKEFLMEQNVLIRLVLKQDLTDEKSQECVIERNFLLRKNKVLRIDGQDLKEAEYEEALTEMLFPGHYGKKPTFKQMVAHNIRYKDLSINNTLKILNGYTSDEEYETLYLFLLGCDFDKGDEKQDLRTKIKLEENFKNRLEKTQTKSAYEAALNLINDEINQLEQRKAELNVNPNFESDLNKLNEIKYQINVVASEISKLDIRKSLIVEAQKGFEESYSSIDLAQLKAIYEQTTSIIGKIQKSFEDLHNFHNKMLEAKIRFITKDLPLIESDLVKKNQELEVLLEKEAELSKLIVRSDSFAALEELISSLNQKYQRKGELENTLSQLKDVDERLEVLSSNLEEIDSELFSKDFSEKVQEQINKFNKFFSMVSNELYGEKYALKVDPKIKNGRKVYKFSAFNTNFSSGKKQGEISCFDIAYILFADDEGIPCMHFLLNDKKELMHDNQLVRIAEFVNTRKIQFVASILKDKLPVMLNKDKYFLVKLSPEDKLFRIESH